MPRILSRHALIFRRLQGFLTGLISLLLGLILAEIELRHEHQHVELPPWIGPDVTGQPQYYNSALVQRPFCSWSRRDTPVPIERLA